MLKLGLQKKIGTYSLGGGFMGRIVSIIKIFLIIAGISSIFGCSGYLSYNTDNLSQYDDVSLMMEGGGYLSSSAANDITPFLFRDKNTGNAYLFFASDRGSATGAYSIYYAQMDSSGKFYNLNKMNSGINQPGTTNYSPVLFQSGGNNYITYVSYVNSTTVNVKTYGINQSFITNSSITFPTSSITDFTQISVFTAADGTVYFIGVEGTDINGEKNIWEYYLSTSTGFWVSTNNITLSIFLYSSAGFQTTSGSAQNLYILYDTISGSKHQLLGLVYVINGATTNQTQFPIPSYSSSANDADPCIDIAGGYKVYFSSDRYGNGYYNLYRYNVQTFDKQVPSSLRSGF